MHIETTPSDTVEHLCDAKSQEALIKAAFAARGDPREIAHALGVIARARGMTQIARDSGVNRRALYKALSKDGDRASAH